MILLVSRRTHYLEVDTLDYEQAMSSAFTASTVTSENSTIENTLVLDASASRGGGQMWCVHNADHLCLVASYAK